MTFARRIAGGWRLSNVNFVPYALQAQFLLVSAQTETEPVSSCCANDRASPWNLSVDQR
jgi:hypothetical protein